MKQFILYATIFLLLSVTLKSQHPDWKMVDSISGSYGSILGLQCYDSLNCMYFIQLYGQGGHILNRTTDGGESWEMMYMDSAYAKGWDTIYNVPRLREIAYPNEKLVIAVGDSGLILLSTDKGLTWDKKRLNLDYEIYRIRMYDDNIGLLQGALHSDFSSWYLYETTDGGKTWEEFYKPNVFTGLWCMQYITPNRFVGISEFLEQDTSIRKHCLINSYNNFETWDTVKAPMTRYLSAFDHNIIWSASGLRILDSAGWTKSKQLIYRTTDAGKNWETQRDTVYNGRGINGIDFFDKNFGVAGGGFGHTMMTFDGGEHWEDLALEYRAPNDGSSGIVELIQVPSYTTAYVVFNFSKIYKYTRPTTDVLHENKKEEILITPNPATDYIEIQMNNHILQGVVESVKVFDVLGVEVLKATTPSLRDTPPYEGGKSISIDVSGLAPGVYFVRVGGLVSKFVKM